MRASIVAANALLVVCIAVAQSVGTERASAGATTPKLAVASSPVCRAAVWPYVPAECGAQDAPRPVRVLRVETGR